MPELKEATVTWMQLIVAVEEGRLILTGLMKIETLYVLILYRARKT